MSDEGIRLYCGLTDATWNTVEADAGPYACVSPVYGKKSVKSTSPYVKEGTSVIQDSGAFSDPPEERLSPKEALQRQILHAEKYEYADKVTHRVTYDRLIDEKWDSGKRKKVRWEEEDAWMAVEETVQAAQWADAHRGDEVGIVFSAQGVTANQYSQCVAELLPLIDPSRDVLGLGGWCILGVKKSKWMPEFWRTVQTVLPMAYAWGIKHVHIFGVMYAPALGGLLWACDQYNILLSTDSSGPAVRPALSRRWGYADWAKKCYFEPGRERGLARIQHIKEVRKWLRGFRKTQYYQNPFH